MRSTYAYGRKKAAHTNENVACVAMCPSCPLFFRWPSPQRSPSRLAGCGCIHVTKKGHTHFYPGESSFSFAGSVVFFVVYLFVCLFVCLFVYFLCPVRTMKARFNVFSFSVLLKLKMLRSLAATLEFFKLHCCERIFTLVSSYRSHGSSSFST
jgi:hypothetical protein